MVTEVERPFAFELAGLTVRGKIDRIERHEGTGEVRILDFKTSDGVIPPAAAHIRPLRTGETVPEWARFDDGGVTRTWVDLQLPIYLQAMAGEFQGRPAAGYYVLPKAAGETRLLLWEEYSPALHEAAMRCAAGACAAIRAGEFWPPNENVRPEWDECAALLHRGAADSIAWAPS